MRKIFKVFKRDIKNIVKNPAAIVIITGLCFIPSLYAWVNIKACWDPYVNTGAIPVAVVNNDTGAKINGKDINVGNEIVEQLKKNKSIGWKIVGDWQGNYGLNEGKYYALIEIPQNFSSDLATLLTDNPKKPDIIYKANEKVNAIATKITNVAKTKLTEEITSKFVDTVNEEAFKYLNEFGGEIEKNKSTILDFKSALNDAQDNLDQVSNQLNASTQDISDVQDYLAKTKTQLPTITNSINSLQGMIEGSKDLITSTQMSVQNLSSGIKNDLMQIQSINNQYNELLSNLKDTYNNTIGDSKDNAKLDKTIEDMQTTLDTSNNYITTAKQILGNINGIFGSSIIETQISTLSNLQDIISQDKNNLTKLKSIIDSGKNTDDVNNTINTLSNLNTDFTNRLTNSSNNFYNNVVPVLNAVGDNLSQGATSASNVLEGSKIIVPQLNTLANFGIASGDVASSQIANVSTKLDEFKSKLSKVQD